MNLLVVISSISRFTARLGLYVSFVFPLLKPGLACNNAADAQHFDYPLLGKGYSYGVDLGQGDSVPTSCQCKPPLYLAPLGRNLRCKFSVAAVSTSLGKEGDRIEGRRWVP